ncbi:MAG: Lrp/AsnC family transcriptional regulator [Moritella sp.]|uniref:Lrp/AsnC family transcriptional regulator n=1 Tax=Moritella sp. TaxID=78556 RepID=UPI001DC60734|nr:Lrp/AsnC family transcriptional regulator [Moritella sp.]NQZ48626.1 Lrp/AsnC family transcriptional regulator [Moritella sp.]
MKIDKINTNILHNLKSDGRVSMSELSERVGLSVSACLRRVQELERTGIIEGYYAKLNSQKLGKSFVAYVTIGLSDHSKTSLERFEKAVLAAEEITECHNTTGTTEYLLRIEATDLKHYKLFHTDVLGTLPQVNSIMTSVVMDSLKY